MNVKESIEFLKEKHLEIVKESICLDFFFYSYQSDINESSPFISFITDVHHKINNDQTFSINKNEYEMLEEAKEYLKDNIYCVCYINWIEYFYKKSEKEFKKSLDESVEYYFLNTYETYSTPNIVYLITLSKRILSNNLNHLMSLIKQKIYSNNRKIEYITFIRHIVDIFGEKEAKQCILLRDCFSYLSDIDIGDGVDGLTVLLFIEQWMKLFSDDTKVAKQKFIDIVLDNYLTKDIHESQLYMQRCRDYIGNTKYRTRDLKQLDDAIKRIGKSALDRMKEQRIYLPDKAQKALKAQEEAIVETLNALSNIDKLFWLLSNNGPIHKDELIKFDDDFKNESVFAKFVTEHLFDSNGEIINYKELSNTEKDSLRIHTAFNITIQLQQTNFYCFNSTFTLDDEVRKYIKDISEHNKLINDVWKNTFVNSFIGFLEGDFAGIFNNILPMFEGCLRYYLDNEGLYVKKINSGDYINCNDIFNHNPQNEYRDKLLETIDENYYFILTWLLTDKYGKNLRNKDLHGISNPQESKTLDVYYTEYLILRMFFGYMISQ